MIAFREVLMLKWVILLPYIHSVPDSVRWQFCFQMWCLFNTVTLVCIIRCYLLQRAEEKCVPTIHSATAGFGQVESCLGTMQNYSATLGFTIHPSLVALVAAVRNKLDWMCLIWFLLHCCGKICSLLFSPHIALAYYYLMKLIWWSCWHLQATAAYSHVEPPHGSDSIHLKSWEVKGNTRRLFKNRLTIAAGTNLNAPCKP